MEKSTFRAGVVLLFMILVIRVNAQAEAVVINDILTAPAGAGRGSHSFQDDSCPGAITIRTQDLPLGGGADTVPGVFLQVPDSGSAHVIQEQERDDVGRFSQSTRNLLIGLGAVLLILIIVFVVLLLMPNKSVPARPKPDPTVKSDTRPEDPLGKDTKPTEAIVMPAPQGDVTQLVGNPLAELLVEQGTDLKVVFTISKNTSTIGRAGTRINDVVLTDNTVSKVQATLYFDPVSGRFSIVNEGTKNPTKVSGVVAGQPVVLNGGELIEMGKTALRFRKL